MQWTVQFYEEPNGNSQILDYLNGIEDRKLKAKIFRDIELLQQFGINLSMPHARYLENGIWELRTKQSNNISRILYFTYSNNNIILLNGFIKKTKKTPKIELERVLKYKEDYQRRFTNGL